MILGRPFSVGDYLTEPRTKFTAIIIPEKTRPGGCGTCVVRQLAIGAIQFEVVEARLCGPAL